MVSSFEERLSWEGRSRRQLRYVFRSHPSSSTPKLLEDLIILRLHECGGSFASPSSRKGALRVLIEEALLNTPEQLTQLASSVAADLEAAGRIRRIYDNPAKGNRQHAVYALELCEEVPAEAIPAMQLSAERLMADFSSIPILDLSAESMPRSVLKRLLNVALAMQRTLDRDREICINEVSRLQFLVQQQEWQFRGLMQIAMNLTGKTELELTELAREDSGSIFTSDDIELEDS